METIRKIILRTHGTLLIVMGIAIGIYSTIGTLYGIGNFAFLHENRLGHVGLLQAYELAALTGIVLWMGSYQENKRNWNRIGALFHFFILIVYIIHWDFLTTLPNGELTRNIGATFHLVFLGVESWAGLFSKKS
ncbi:MAG: hypothetical protein H0W61_06150 [Bacteroidetes bacterium]|nr:hypothetical protein [Bacteroidota bacterium]